MKTTAEIRQAFFDYFAGKDHEVVSSSSLVPANDPTLLFTNAGMVQFKDVFLGAEKRACPRAVTSQRCVRAGGKHNDLDQVGYTARHHTFFEMLGNFSFGDYFKNEAIAYSWELLTDVFGLDPSLLWVTVYETDDEAYDIWSSEIGIPAERLVRIGDKPGGRQYESDNFWAMGDTGPCGPCTEIFYDHGPDVAGGPPGSPEEDGDRYIEIWNLVFMQFDRSADGDMVPLPKPCVDTGMGLERLAAVLQNVHSNYEIDLFQALIRSAAGITGCENSESGSLRVIADHIRACAFLIADGVTPSREGRGYVLRRIIRRAIRHGHKLGCKDAFFHRMVEPLVEQMGDAYPELTERANQISTTLLDEEIRFARTLDTGMGILQQVIEKSDETDGRLIDGETAFLLYDTYGFPLDLTQDIARENGMKVDNEGFDKAMARQQERGRSAGGFEQKASLSAEVIGELPETCFTGYDELSTTDTRVAAILIEGKPVETLDEGQSAVLVLDRTPFYAESGGQVGDIGKLVGNGAEFEVRDTQKLAGTFHGHVGKMVSGSMRVGESLTASVDGDRRKAIVLHHSATHLLHAALQKVLGPHVQQKGSLVAPDHLRFDFSHAQPVTSEEINTIEKMVNREIRLNPSSEARVMAYDEAIQTGAQALFGEKYGDQVRVMRFGEFSTELCGGTHVERVGDIGLFKITAETAVASGTRRIEAVAGEAALSWVQNMEDVLRNAARKLNTAPAKLEGQIGVLLEKTRAIQKEIDELKSRLAEASGDDLLSSAQDINGIPVLSVQIKDIDPKAMRETVDHLKDKLGSAVVVIGNTEGGKVRLAAGVSKDLMDKLQAGKLINFVAEQVGGKGGGRPDFAQAGGPDAEKLGTALESVAGWVMENT
jgi:alanyl-tRNA synthetase